ncbi:transposable element Tc1 transposase [Trichonephila clavipes]|nr:transposable element Tc1 transposase [Trichonephila clavipes]
MCKCSGQVVSLTCTPQGQTEYDSLKDPAYQSDCCRRWIHILSERWQEVINTRLQWCFARSGWNHADWRRRVFSDESRFQLRPDDHRRRVWRRPGWRANSAFTTARHTGPQPEVMVWGAISFESWAPLVVIRGTLTA